MKRETLEIAGSMRISLARISRRLRLESRTPGLSVAKHSILGRLYREGPKTPKALALAEGVQPQSLTRVLAELEESGFALRTQDELDRRQFKLEITPEGQQIVIRDAQNRAFWLAASMESRLTGIEKDLLRLLIQLLDKLADAPSLNQTDGTPSVSVKDAPDHI